MFIQKMIHKVRNEKGLSLLEAALGLMVVSVGFLGLLPLMTSATANTLSSDHIMTATFLANEKVEMILADNEFQGYNYLVNANYPAEAQLDGSFSQYSRDVSILEVNTVNLTTYSAGSGYKRVAVTVTWNNEQPVIVTTLITN